MPFNLAEDFLQAIDDCNPYYIDLMRTLLIEGKIPFGDALRVTDFVETNTIIMSHVIDRGYTKMGQEMARCMTKMQVANVMINSEIRDIALWRECFKGKDTINDDKFNLTLSNLITSLVSDENYKFLDFLMEIGVSYERIFRSNPEIFRSGDSPPKDFGGEFPDGYFKKKYDMFEYFLRNGAIPSDASLLSSWVHSADIVQLLIHYDAIVDIFSKDVNGDGELGYFTKIPPLYTPMSAAMFGGHWDTVDLLLEQDVDLTVKIGINLCSYLHLCINPDYWQRIMDAGVDLNTKDKTQETPLFRMVSPDVPLDTLVQFLDLGPKINIKNRERETPLMKAAVHNQDIIPTLIRYGADPDLGYMRYGNYITPKTILCKHPRFEELFNHSMVKKADTTSYSENRTKLFGLQTTSVFMTDDLSPDSEDLSYASEEPEECSGSDFDIFA